MKSVFLVCALALPGSFDHHVPAHHIVVDEITDENRKRIEQVRQLHEFIKKHYPGAEIWIGPIPPTIEYEKTPLLWRDKEVWIKRPPASDRRMKSEA